MLKKVNYKINKRLTSSVCILSKFCGFHMFVTQCGNPSKIDSKLIRDVRFLGLVNVLVSIDFLLPKYKVDLS